MKLIDDMINGVNGSDENDSIWSEVPGTAGGFTLQQWIYQELPECFAMVVA